MEIDNNERKSCDAFEQQVKHIVRLVRRNIPQNSHLLV